MSAAVRRRATVAGVAAGTIALWLVLDGLLARGLPSGVVLRGIISGSLYALSAMGIVLVFRANRVVNFAQAELGAVAAIIAIECRIYLHWNYFVAIGAGLVIAVISGALIDLLVVRVFREAPRLILAVATIGVAQILNGLSIQIPLWITGAAQLQAEPFETPFKTRFTLAPVIFNGNHLLVLVVVPVVCVALAAFLRFTDYGVAIRAAAENGDRANLLGIPVRRLSTLVWAIAGLLSALAVILRVPLVGFASFTSVSGSGPGLLLRVLAAAVIGRMESLPATAAAAVGIGVLEQLSFWTFSNSTYSDAMLVVVILVALLAQRGKFDRARETGISTWKALREVRPIPEELRGLPEVRYGVAGLRVALLLGAMTFPLVASSSQEQLAGIILIYAIVAVSLVVLTGWAGQISLGQWAFVGFGGATTSVLLGGHGWDLFLAVPAGMLVAAGAALLIGLPALRISGPFLAVTTLAFAVTAGSYLLEDRYFPWFVHTAVDRPVLFGRFRFDLDWQMYYVCLVALVLVLGAVKSFRASRTGRALLAARDNEPATQSFGLSVTRLKLTAFAISGAIAGLAGGLYVLHQTSFRTDAFGPEVSLRLFSMVVIGGLGSIPGAILGAVYVRGAEFFLSGGWAVIASGAGLLLLLMLVPGGLGELLYRGRDHLLRLVAARRGIVVPSLVADLRVEATDDDERIPLEDALAGLLTNAPDERVDVAVLR
jgi:branched-chain amino acid transport system permease protein